MPGKIPGSNIHDNIDVVHLDIIDLMAVGTDKMLVVLYGAVIMICTASGGNLCNLSEICQQ